MQQRGVEFLGPKHVYPTMVRVLHIVELECLDDMGGSYIGVVPKCVLRGEVSVSITLSQ